MRNFQKFIIFTFLSNKPTWWKKFKDKQNRVPALQGLTDKQLFATIQNTLIGNLLLYIPDPILRCRAVEGSGRGIRSRDALYRWEQWGSGELVTGSRALSH